MNTIDIYRGETIQATVNIDEKTVLYKKLMGEHRITAEFYANAPLPVQIGDFITYEGEQFTINRLPGVTKLNSFTFQYKIDFEGPQYNLQRKLLISTDGLTEFSYNGQPSDFVTMIVNAINEIDDNTWTVGTIEETDEDYRTLTFANEYCLAALTRIAQEFNLEWTIDNKAISLIKSAGADTTYLFQYGRGNGLYKIERQQVNDQNILTKVYGFGGTTNIPETYRNRAKRLVFDDNGNRFLTKNADLYGIIEGQLTDDTIFPSRTGTVSAVTATFDAGTSGTDYNPRTSYIEDTSLDFNINDCMLEGQTPTIVFKTGDLAGSEFEIWKYDATNKCIYFNPYADSDGYVLPRYNDGSPIAPQAGDTYTLVNISLPQSYIDAAETKLKAATQEFIDENSVPMAVYTIEIDPRHAASIPLILDTGDRVQITDTDLGIDAMIRVAGLEYPLINPFKIKATIADFVPYTLQERIIKQTITNKIDTIITDRSQEELARRMTLRMKQLQNALFDPDGTFDPNVIDPVALETLLISVGATSQNFRLNGVTIRPNVINQNLIDQGFDEFQISGGQLIHNSLNNNGNYIWDLEATSGALNITKSYYLYALCMQFNNTGLWWLSTEKYKFDQWAGVYLLWIGIIYKPVNGVRDFDFTYGATYINGRTITTGRIRSIDQQNYFDLDQNQFKMGNENSSLDWNVTNPATLTLRGAMVQSSSGYFPIPVFCGAYDPLVTFQRGNQVTYSGSTWTFINATPAAGQTPAEGAFWTQSAAAGADGTSASPKAINYRGEWSPTTAYYNNQYIQDVAKAEGAYYLYIGPDGATAGSHLAEYWQPFGSNWESVATGLLLAERATINNLYTQDFQGIPVTAGDLNAYLEAHYPYDEGQPQIDIITLHTATGTTNITVNGITRPLTWMGSIQATIDDFILNQSAYYINISVWQNSETQIGFEGTTTEPFQGQTAISSSFGTAQTVQYAYGPYFERFAFILQGTSGRAKVIWGELEADIEFNTDLPTTAANFVQENYQYFYNNNILVALNGASVNGPRIELCWMPTGNAENQPTITTITEAEVGGISMRANQIWENTEDSNLGTISINRKGYQGGITRFRNFNIYNGKGEIMAVFAGDNNGNTIGIWARNVVFIGLPNSSSGLIGGQIYRDGNTLKIV